MRVTSIHFFFFFIYRLCFLNYVSMNGIGIMTSVSDGFFLLTRLLTTKNLVESIEKNLYEYNFKVPEY